VSKATTPAPAEAKRFDEVMAWIHRAEEGDQTVLPALREVLKAEPTAADLLGGDLAKQAQQTLIKKFSEKNLLVKESLTRKLELLHAELAGPQPTTLERLLVERIVACWLYLHHLEVIFASKESMSLDLGSYYQRSITSAQKRYLAAIKTLAVVRKLAVPVLQVNIARKQVNVAGPFATPDGDSNMP
jgi:hypothetical protein